MRLIDGSKLAAFRADLRGIACAPGEEGYDEARRAWNLNAHQHLALVVMAAGAADVFAAVRLARDEGLGVGVMATGHSVAYPCDEGVLQHLADEGRACRSRDADRAGGSRRAVARREAQAFRLAGLVGSSSGVGVVGYTLGGGFDWLGRKYGFNADSLREADLVTADGTLLKVNAYEHPDLFWGLKGSAGNFGAVTSLEFALYPLTTVYDWGLYYPVEMAEEVLELYRR